MTPPRPRPNRSRPLVPGRTAAGAGQALGPADGLAALVLLAIAWWVYRGALTYFFSQDDFAWLAHASGLLPPLSGLWRYLSHQAYFEAMWRTFGPRPLPYHVVSLAAHAGCALIVFAIARRWTGTPAALIGAAFFAAHPSHYTAVYWISAISTVLSGGFAWAALLAVTWSERRRWWAVPLFAAALGCKESNLLAPVSAAARPAPAGASGARRAWRVDPVVIAMALASLVFWIATRGARGVGASLGEGAAYDLEFGIGALRNLLTYVGWSVNFTFPTVRQFSDALEPALDPVAGLAIAAWIAGLFSPALRERGWPWAGVTFLLLLAPVLPLAHHTYRYYLYAPLGAVALLLAALADSWLRRVGNRLAWGIALGGALVLAVNGQALVHEVETHPLAIPGLRADATVDRARIAERVGQDLRAAELPARARLYFWWGESARRYHDALVSGTPAPAEPVERYEEANLRAALMDGLAIRVLLPGVDSVSFVRAPVLPADGARYVLYDATGRSRVIAPATLDSLLRAP